MPPFRSPGPAVGPALPLLLGLLGVLSAWLAFNLIAVRWHDGAAAFGDFQALWSYGRVQRDHPAALLYDFEGLHAAQVALGMAAGTHGPFAYPPPMALLVRPLGLVPIGLALGIWIAAQLLFYLWAVLGADGGSPVPRFRLEPLAMGTALILAPTAVLTVLEGQGGFLTAGLLIGGMRRAALRPVLGGVLLGLLSYKPQLGVLVPIALLAAGWWRCAAAACVTVLMLALASAVAFGPGIWDAWLRSLPQYQDWFDRAVELRPLMPTVVASLQMLGLPDRMAVAGQGIAAVLAAAAVWIGFRRLKPGAGRAPAIAVLVAATCLATPHAFIYDLPMLDAAVVLLAADSLRHRGGLGAVELAVLLAVLLFPAAMGLVWMPAAPLILAAFLALAWRRVAL